MPQHPVRSARIIGVPAQMEQTAGYVSRGFLFDDERPEMSADDLLAERGGKIKDTDVNHGCPFCHKPMAYDLFVAHLLPCVKKNRRPKRFAGVELSNA